jgi:hypothetical protein
VAFIGLGAVLLSAAGGVAYLVSKGAWLPPKSVEQQTTPQPPVPQPQPQPQRTASETDSKTLPATPPPCAANSSSNGYDDDFKSQDIGWSPAIGDDKTRYEKGNLIVSPSLARGFPEMYLPLVFADANACALIMNPSLRLAQVAEAGVVFWYQDGNNYYVATVKLPSARAYIYRYVDGNGYVIRSLEAPQVKTGPSEINKIQIQTKGAYGAEYVNGTRVFEFKGQPPGRGPLGIFATSEEQQRTQWTFLDFSVSEYK